MDLTKAIHEHDVPIVSETTALTSFKDFDFQLQIDQGDQLGGPMRLRPKVWVLVLSQDLEAICDMMRLRSFKHNRGVHFMLKEKGDAAAPVRAFFDHNAVLLTFHTRVILNKQCYTAQKAGLQAIPFNILHNLRTPGQVISLLNKPDEQSEVTLRSIAGSRQIWVKVAAWDLLNLAKSRMEVCKSLLDQSDYERAAEHFESIFAVFDEHHLFCNLPEAAHSSDAAPPLILWARTLIEAISCYGFLRLREYDLNGAMRAR